MNILETKRLILRTTNQEDLNSLYDEIFCNAEVVKLTFGNELFDIKQTEEFIKTNCNFDGKLGLSTLIEKSSGKVIGLAGVIECDYENLEGYEFGFILGKSFWGKGYATEIGQAQIDFIKYEMKTGKIAALVHKENIGSVKTIKKLGLTYLTTVSTQNRGVREVYSII